MTNEEALNWFKDDLKNGKCSDECPQCNAMEKAIEALEKQIAQKPIVEKIVIYKESPCGTYKIASCPNCKELLGLYGYEKESFQCCYDCGQAFDWSNTNA